MAKSIADRIRARRLPNVDVPTVDDQSLRQHLEGLKEHIRMYEGDSNAPKERFVTVEELETAGVIKTEVKQGFALITEFNGIPIGTPTSDKTVTGVSTLRDLTDTAVEGGKTTQYLQLDAGKWRPSYVYFKNLRDVDLANTAQYDMVYNATGSTWKDTAGALQWNPTNGYMQFATSKSINWLNAADGSVELVILTPGQGGTLPDVDTVSYADATTAGDLFAELSCADVSPDGAYLFATSLRLSNVGRYPLTTPYDLTTISSADQVSAQINSNSANLREMRWSTDGVIFFYLKDIPHEIYSQPVLSPYNVDDLLTTPDKTASFPGTGDTYGFDLSPNGDKLIICTADGEVKCYTLTTPWDVETKVETATGLFIDDAAHVYQGIVVSADGMKYWVLEKTNDKIYQYSMATPWDQSTASYDSLSSELNDATNLFISMSAGQGAGHLWVAYYGVASVDDCIVEGYTFAGTATEDFVLGDPAYGTVIDGSRVDISGPTTIGSTLDVAAAVIFRSTLDITGELTFNSKMNANVTTVITTSHTAGAEHIILVDDDTAAADVTIALPAAATAKTVYHIKKLGTTASVIVDADGAETIDGETTVTLTMQYESIMLVSDGTTWNII